MDLNTPIVDAHGRQTFTFGGQNAYATEIYKGYFVSLEWFVGRRSTEPLMLIRAANAGQYSDAGAFGVCLSSIGLYADPDTGSNAAPGALARVKREALPTLGKAYLDAEARTVLDVILHFAPRLILMPPTPRDVVRDAMPAPIIDVDLSIGGKAHSQVSV